MTSAHSLIDPPTPPLEPQVLRCTTTADFLAALPQLMGFVATNSLCVVFFSGKRAGPTMRVDLPASDDSRDVTDFINAVCDIIRRTMARYGVDAPAIVISSDTSFAEVGGVPWRRLARRLERRLEREGMRVRELCCIAPDAWVSYLDPAAPVAGRSLAEVADSPVASRETSPTLDSLGSFAEPDAHELGALHEALIDAARVGGAPGAVRDAEVAAAVVCEQEPTITDLAQLIHTANRDDGWFAIVEQLSATASAMHSIDAISPGSDASAGDRLRAAARRLVHAAELCPDHLRPSVISVCAYAWWLRGLQSVAARQVAVALRLSPDHEHARIMGQLIDEGACPLVTRSA